MTRGRVVTLVASLALIIPILVPSTVGAAATLRVDPADPAAYRTISSAVASAAVGDVVLVAPGRYPEIVGLKSGVEIKAVASSTPVVLDGEGVRRPLTAVGVTDATLTGLVISAGRGDPDGGALASVGSTVALADCVLKGGSAGKGGAVFASPTAGGPRGRVRVINCTIVGNSASSGAAVWSSQTPVNLTNTIVWGNGSARSAELVGPCRATYSDVPLAGTGNLNADPRFANAGSGDYTLVLGSPCVDTASRIGAPVTDIVGATRPQDGDGDGLSGVDMGAHERPTCTGGPTVLAIMSSTARVAYGRTAVVTGMLRDGGGAVSGCDDVTLWSAGRSGGAMSRVAVATWNEARGVYVAQVACIADRWLQLRYSGEGTRCASRSQVVRVRGGAGLSTPTIKGPIYRGGTFTVSGTLRPSERGTVGLYFYRQSAGGWRLYGRSHAVRLEQHRSFARYTLTTRLPDAGAWCVKARHADDNHLPTWSRPLYFTVDLFPAGRFIFPVAGKHHFTDTWGAPRSGHTHQGTDIYADFGTPCVAVVAGSVTTKEGGSAGRSVWLTAKDGTKYFYAHLQGWAVRRGRVRAGQVVGYAGNTGNASGGTPHLHFGIQLKGTWVNPYRTLLAAKKVRAPAKKSARKSVLSRPVVSPSGPRPKRYFRVSGTLTPGARAWVRLAFFRQVGRKWARLRTVRVRGTVARGRWFARYDSRNRVPLPGRYYVRVSYAARGRATVYGKLKYFRVR